MVYVIYAAAALGDILLVASPSGHGSGWASRCGGCFRGMASLAAFSYLLTLIPTDAAG